jgi:hypothetical protein
MLTREQTAIVSSAGNIKINAVAGSGKTTTLIEYARVRPGEKILYLAFNRAVKLEAEVSKPAKSAEKSYSYKSVREKNKSAYAPWTDSEDKKLMDLFYGGKSTKELARIFERTTGSIISRIKKMKL